MEQMMKCPLCGTENKRTYYSEDVGLVEDHYVCKYCGYTKEMAYSPEYVGVDTSLADDGVWPTPERMWDLVQTEQDGRLVVLDDEKALALAAVVHGCNTNRRLVGASFVQDIYGLYGGPKTISYYRAIEIMQGLLAAEAVLKGEGHEEAE